MAEEEMDVPVDKMAIVMKNLLSKETKTVGMSRKRKLQQDEDSIASDVVSKTDPASLCHVPPDPLLWEHERSLKRLATKGVVQLFNAVNKQQKELEHKLEKVGLSESKRSKVMASVDKKEFLNMLKDKQAIKSSNDNLF